MRRAAVPDNLPEIEKRKRECLWVPSRKNKNRNKKSQWAQMVVGWIGQQCLHWRSSLWWRLSLRRKWSDPEITITVLSYSDHAPTDRCFSGARRCKDQKMVVVHPVHFFLEMQLFSMCKVSKMGTTTAEHLLDQCLRCECVCLPHRNII